MVEVAKKLNFKEIVESLDSLTVGERETLSILCDPQLVKEIKKADREALKELRQGKTISLEEFLKEIK